MAVRRATRSTRSSSGEATIPSKARPVSPDSAWREVTAAVARSAAAMSSGVRPVAWASSDNVGSRPSWAVSWFRARWMARACSFWPRLTFTGPSSRRKRRISPAILGTA